jgi:hypothetical protein
LGLQTDLDHLHGRYHGNSLRDARHHPRKENLCSRPCNWSITILILKNKAAALSEQIDAYDCDITLSAVVGVIHMPISKHFHEPQLAM